MYETFLTDLAEIEEIANMSDERCHCMEGVLPDTAVKAIRRIVAAGRTRYGNEPGDPAHRGRNEPGARGCAEEVTA